MIKIRNACNYLHGKFPNRKKNGPPEKEKILTQKVDTITKVYHQHHILIPLSN